MQWGNLSKLVKEIENDIKNVGYFEMTMKKGDDQLVEVEREQKGTFRTNCMDCLDRTNVVQGVIARNVMHDILTKTQLFIKTDVCFLQSLCDLNYILVERSVC